jgi:hypothetical protein
MSRYQLSFSERIGYENSPDITIPIALYTDVSLSVPIAAKLDCGSTLCVFQRKFGEMLGLDVESGIPERIGTATGSFPAYGHDVTSTTCGLEWQAVVYFAESYAFYLNVVGRIGFLDHLRIALIDHDQEFYLNHYDEV